MPVDQIIDLLGNLLATWWPAAGPWLAAAVIPFAKGFVGDLLAEMRKNQALVNAGAAQQRQADRTANDEIAARAKATGDKIAEMSDADVDRDLSRWRSSG